MSEVEQIVYNTEDVAAAISLQVVKRADWLTQLEMAELFDTSKQNVSLHLNSILLERGTGGGFSCQVILDNCRGWQVLSDVVRAGLVSVDGR